MNPDLIEVVMLKDFTFTRGWNYLLPATIALELIERGYAAPTKALPPTTVDTRGNAA